MKKEGILSSIQNFVFILVIVALISSFATLFDKSDFGGSTNSTIGGGSINSTIGGGSINSTIGGGSNNCAHSKMSAWTTVTSSDANYERRDCSVCGRYQLREKNTPVTGEMTVSSVVNYTDALHGNSIATGGKYNVFEMDFRLGTGATTDTSVNHFRIYLKDSRDNNVKYINFASFGSKVKVDDVLLDAKYVANDDNGTWITIRVVDEIPESGADYNYYHNVKIFVKLRDTDSEFELVRTASNISSHCAPNREYKVTFEHINDKLYEFTNASLIRTNDANYLYSACAHNEMSVWNLVTEVGCDTDGVVTRNCTANGCGYTETEYVPATGYTSVVD